MSDSFFYRTHPIKQTWTGKRPVLVTGASGRIGSTFADAMKDRYDLKLMVRPGSDTAGLPDCGDVVEADLADLDRIREITKGIDTVLHLAADPSPRAKWESLLPNNIQGTYHVVQAAIENKCRRLVFASSIHAVSGYPIDRQVHADDPVNPGDLYGVSKCFMEALARYAAGQRDLSCIGVRIGSFASKTKASESDSVHLMNTFASVGDIVQLFEKCIEEDRIGFAIVHGLSGNLFNRMDITSAKELFDYDPKDDFSELHPTLRELNFRDQVRPHSEQGKK